MSRAPQASASSSSSCAAASSSSAGLDKPFLGLALRCNNAGSQIPPTRPSLVRVLANAAAVAEPEVEAPRSMPNLKNVYLTKAVPALKEEFKYANDMQVPKVKKVVVNCGVGEAAQNAKALEATVRDISLITGQKPVVTRARKAIAGFKLRKGVPVGVVVTLRGEVMYAFLDRLLNLALPRTRDFQGVNPYGFDGRGNYTLGLRQQSVFPEIKFELIDQERGMDVSIITTAPTDQESQKLLTLLGMPYKENAVRAIKMRRKGKLMRKGGKPAKPAKPQKKKK